MLERKKENTGLCLIASACIYPTRNYNVFCGPDRSVFDLNSPTRSIVQGCIGHEGFCMLIPPAAASKHMKTKNPPISSSSQTSFETLTTRNQAQLERSDVKVLATIKHRHLRVQARGPCRERTPPAVLLISWATPMMPALKALSRSPRPPSLLGVCTLCFGGGYTLGCSP